MYIQLTLEQQGGLGVSILYEVENLSVLYSWPSIYMVPLHTWFLYILGSSHICDCTDMDSADLGCIVL